MKDVALDLLLTFADTDNDPTEDGSSFSHMLGTFLALGRAVYAAESEENDLEEARVVENNAGIGGAHQEVMAEGEPQRKRRYRGSRSGTKTNRTHRAQASARVNKVPRKVPHPRDPLLQSPAYSPEQPPEYPEADNED